MNADGSGTASISNNLALDMVPSWHSETPLPPQQVNMAGTTVTTPATTPLANTGAEIMAFLISGAVMLSAGGVLFRQFIMMLSPRYGLCGSYGTKFDTQ